MLDAYCSGFHPRTLTREVHEAPGEKGVCRPFARRSALPRLVAHLKLRYRADESALSVAQGQLSTVVPSSRSTSAIFTT